MKTIHLALLASVASTPLMAEETREMDAHVHGVSKLELALEGDVLAMNMLSPGMDIVGFEYEASTDADKDAVEAAIRAMLIPENIVTLPDAAECRLTEVLAHLHSGDHDHAEKDDHDHAEEGDHDHAEGEDHDHSEDKDHDDHAKADDHEHGDHEDGDEHEHEHEGAEHSEFHVRYMFSCEHPDALTTLGFPFFERFENAQEIEAQYVTDAGAGAAEIARDVAKLTLK